METNSRAESQAFVEVLFTLKILQINFVIYEIIFSPNQK